jgi:hypothetical protein
MTHRLNDSLTQKISNPENAVLDICILLGQQRRRVICFGEMEIFS